MKNTRRYLAAGIAVVILFACSGCWNYREIDKLALVAGAAFDRDTSNGGYIVTVEIMNPKLDAKGTRIESEIVQINGETVFDAVRGLVSKTGKKLYWSHAKAMIISQDIARQGIIPVIDLMGRDAEARHDISLLISKEDTAGEILRGKIGTYDIISIYIESMLNARGATSRFFGVDLWEFISGLAAKAASQTLPAIGLTRSGSNPEPEIYGSAVMKEDRLVGWFDGIETRSMLFVKNKLKGGVIALSSEGNKVSLEIFENNTKVSPVNIDGKLTMRVKVKPGVSIGEIEGSVNFIDEEGRKILKGDADELLKGQIEAVIKKAQKEYGTDIFEFGEIIQRDMPDMWRRIESDWDSIFPELDVDVSVDTEIRGSATAYKPIKEGE